MLQNCERPDMRAQLARENAELRGRVKAMEVKINGLLRRLMEMRRQLEQRRVNQ